MKKIKINIALPVLLLLSLFLVGVSCKTGGLEKLTKSGGAESYYKKLCKISVPFQKKAMAYYGMDELDEEQAAAMGYYKNVDQCLEKSIEFEEKLEEECLKEKTKKECQEMVDQWREAAAKILTREGCENFYKGLQCMYYNPGEEIMKQATPEERAYLEGKYAECVGEIEELCQNLPEEI